MNKCSGAGIASVLICGTLYLALGQTFLSSLVASIACALAIIKQGKSSTNTEISVPKVQKETSNFGNQTDLKEFFTLETQTEYIPKPLNFFECQTEKIQISNASSQSEKSEFKSISSSCSIAPTKKQMKNVSSHTEIHSRDQSTNTAVLDCKDREVQVWCIQNDVEINTTQSLNGPVLKNNEISIQTGVSQIEEEEKEPVRDKPKHYDSPLKMEEKAYRPEIYQKDEKFKEETYRPRANSEDVLGQSAMLENELYTNESDSEQSYNKKEEIEFEKSILMWSKPAIMMHVSSVTLSDDKLVSTLHINMPMSKLSRRPLCTLFLAPYELDFVEVFGPQSFSLDYIDIYTTIPPVHNLLNDPVFDKISSWYLGTYLSDFIILVVDFSQHPDIHQDPLLTKYFLLLKEIERPIYILHKVSSTISYAYSFKRVNEIMESTWENDRVVLHEELGDNIDNNNGLLVQIKEQMSDNLLDPDAVLDLSEKFRISFDSILEKMLSIQNSRKRELLVNGEVFQVEEGLCCALQMEPSWSCIVREQWSHNLTRNTIYLTPAEYHIDEDISCELISPHYSNISDHLVKVGIVSNVPAEKLGFNYLQTLHSCFTQHKDEIALIIPSSKQLLISQFNHINSLKFNLAFQHLLLDQLSNCSILSLFYDKDKLIESEDGFEGLARMLKVHYKEGSKKPMMVLHHFPKESDSSEYFSFFLKATEDFSHFLSKWAGIEVSKQLSTHQKNNEGIYAFDQDLQIIHRLIVPNAPIGWNWYNAILYKIMHNAALKDIQLNIKTFAQKSFSRVLKEMIKIYEFDEPVIPIAQCTDGEPNRFQIKLFTNLSPSWTLEKVEIAHERLEENRDPNV
ncbi:unnamed protein product [Blepharisma stoltei]|uniref:Uncharacterized protein n=1 Tax=Blepharisma stoltei TaxID=1481888 RepID=A0AAU9JY34_9CILI|nr:unnamed protein product [Blepharisma stoltei]